jgi:hypothetical protein
MIYKNLAIFAFPLKIQHLLALGYLLFPAGFIPVMIGRTAGKDILRALQKIPTRLFSVPEISHGFSPFLRIFPYQPRWTEPIPQNNH